MPTLVPLCFLFGWMLPADSMEDIPLSMVEDSVDDMYDGCQPEMMKKVKKDYFEKEMQNKEFKDAWSNAASCAIKKPRVEDKSLTKDHMQAICVYTGNDIYEMFNEAVLKQGPVYNTTFRFHSLHFLLTSAIQILNPKHHCYTTYRRTTRTFTGLENMLFRFGTFASSSYNKGLTTFGSKTCFKIKTCFGAYLRHYSTFGDVELEVLIPPYETFRVTKKMIGQGKHTELEDCEVVYELGSAGVKSQLNCREIHPQGSSASSFGLQEIPQSSSFLTLITVVTHFGLTLYIFFWCLSQTAKTTVIPLIDASEEHSPALKTCSFGLVSLSPALTSQT